MILLLSRQQHIMMKHFHPHRNQHTASDLFFFLFFFLVRVDFSDLMAFGRRFISGFLLDHRIRESRDCSVCASVSFGVSLNRVDLKKLRMYLPKQ